ncbi:MAG: non-specific serine/threonine protein kinase [Acidimicrobiaceae bacterium]
MAAPAELAPGATLHAGRYVIRGVLGRGGVGITYQADDERLQRSVAVKELFPGAAVRVDGRVLPPAHEARAFAEAKARFLREASVLARFTDPGVVRVYEVFEEAGTAYLVMELLDGGSLSDLLVRRRGLLTEAEALDVALRCARALAVVHAAGSPTPADASTNGLTSTVVVSTLHTPPSRSRPRRPSWRQGRRCTPAAT